MKTSSEPAGPSSTVFRPIVYSLAELGLDGRSFLKACGVDPAVVDDPQASVPRPVFDAFWVQAAERRNDPCFGLHVAERLRPMAVNLAGYLLMSSASVRHGLDRVSHYQKLVFGAEWIQLLDRGPLTAIRIGIAKGEPAQGRIQTEYAAALILKLVDWVTADDTRASQVHFRHEPAVNHSEYERVLRCPVKFGCPYDELTLARSSLDQPSLHANPEIAELHERYAKQHLAEWGEASVAREVKTLLMSDLDRRTCELSRVARQLHMSARTLQRRLAGEGTSYQELLDSLRKELCLQHLANPEIGLSEIAYLAGFSDTSALTRAVRRWTGQSPLAFRQSRLEPAS